MEPYQLVREATYFRNVLNSMLDNKITALEAVRVRFGRQGEGVAPNYQIIREDGSVRRYAGLGHKLFHDAPTEPFEEANLSPGVFGPRDVQEMIASASAS